MSCARIHNERGMFHSCVRAVAVSGRAPALILAVIAMTTLHATAFRHGQCGTHVGKLRLSSDMDSVGKLRPVAHMWESSENLGYSIHQFEQRLARPQSM